MISRKLQYQNGSFFTVIPKAFVELLGLVPGEEVVFEYKENVLRITPATESAKIGAAGEARNKRSRHDRKHPTPT